MGNAMTRALTAASVEARMQGGLQLKRMIGARV